MKRKTLQTAVVLGIAAMIACIYAIKNPAGGDGEGRASAEGGAGQADFAFEAVEPIDYEALSAHGIPIIVDYGSDSCIPCKRMAPVLRTLNEKMRGKAFVKFADVWKHNGIADNVPVSLIPSQVFVNADGTPFVPSDRLSSRIRFVRHQDKDTGKHVLTLHQGGLTEEDMLLILKEMGVE